MSDSRYRPRRNFHTNGPSWWRTMTTEVPNRAETRRLSREVVRGMDPYEATWPVWNRPKMYWW